MKRLELTEEYTRRAYDTAIQQEQNDPNPHRLRRLNDENSPIQLAKKQQQDSGRQFVDLLAQKMLNEFYVELYQKAVTLLAEAKIEADTTIRELRASLDLKKLAFKTSLAGANQLPDGTRVFLDDNGDGWTEDDRKLTKEEMQTVLWKDGAMKRSEFLFKRDDIRRHEEYIRQWERYEVDVLGDSHQRLRDKVNPPAADDVQDIIKDIQEQKPILEKPLADPSEYAKKTLSTPTTDMAIPTLK